MFLNSSWVKEELSREILKSIAYQNFWRPTREVLRAEIHIAFILERKVSNQYAFTLGEKKSKLNQKEPEEKEKMS